jgi:hypothetical protein
MTARKSKTKAPAKGAGKQTGDDRAMIVQAEKGESEAASMSRVMLAPFLRHGIVTNGIADKMVGPLPGAPRFDDYAQSIKARTEKTATGDLAIASEMLTAQALTLDAIFTEMARRSVLNMGDYLDASERYMRLALKAQANSRATIEALAKLHSPREQTVRHVHVNEGGQAVIAEQFHNHTRGAEYGKSAGQPHAPGNGAVDAGPALPSPDPLGEAMPIPSREGERAVQDARGQGQRSA